MTATTSPQRLTIGGLKSLPDHVLKPAHDLNKVSPGILHIGLGGFALAHLCHYINGVLVNDPSWGIIAASIRSDSRGFISGLRKQDNLYSLVVRQGDERTASIMAPIVQTLLSTEGAGKIVDAIANPQIKLVTLTVSNNAYFIDNPHSTLKTHSADIVHDLNLETETPKTIYWYLTNGLKARKQTGKPLTVMSLDNVQDNSRSLKMGLLQFVNEAGLHDLATWIEQNVDFPVSTVDRITPETTDEVRKESLKLLGMESAVVVGTEKYHSLVVERSRFEMPDWAAQGVQTVDDCSPYWQMKFFCLNAAHCVASMVGLRAGNKFVHDGLLPKPIAGEGESSAPFILQLLKRVHREFAVFVPGGEARVLPYAETIYARFANSALGDENERVAARGTSKVNERLLAAVELALAADSGRLISVPVFTSACWLLNLGGYGEGAVDGKKISLGDSHAASLTPVHDAVVAWLDKVTEIPATPETAPTKVVHDALLKIGETVKESRFMRMAANEKLVRELSWCLINIHHNGVEAAAQVLLARA